MAATRYREPDYYSNGDIAAYRDPAQTIFANIPATSPAVETRNPPHITNGGYGDPESISYASHRPFEELRASRKWSEGTNPYNWPMRPPANDPHEWPMKPPTGSPIVPAQPPKPPSTTFEIQTEDTVLPLRPWVNKSGSSFGSTERYDGASIRPVPSMNSMTTVRPALYPSVPERPVTSTSSSPGSSTRSSGLLGMPSFDNGRPVSSGSMPLPHATTPGGRIIVAPAPSPPLQSSISSEHGQTYPPLLNSSIRPVSSARPFITTHIRPLSPEGLPPDQTPVVEAGYRSPMARRSHPAFSSTQSQASTSPPPSSPPPPYSNSHASSRRRTNSYYALAQERSDRIITQSSPPPPIPAHPAFRHDSVPSALSASPPLDRNSLLPSRSAASLPIEEPRPLSAALTDSSYMTDDTVDSTSQTTHPPSMSVGTASTQPTSSSYPGARQYRPSSAASAPSEEVRSRASSSSSVYSTGTQYQRSYSMATIMAEEDDDELGLRATESAPAGIRRKPLPPRTNVTDTYKEVIIQEPAFDTLKEVTHRSAHINTSRRHSKEPDPDPNMMHRPRPRDMRKRFTDTSKQVVVPESELFVATSPGPSALPVLRSPLEDTIKEMVPDTPVEPQTQPAPLPPPTSQVDMIRKRNLERRQQQQQAGKRRLRIVNA